MRMQRCAVLLILVLFAALAGCSHQEEFSPITPDMRPFPMRAAVIGPSEIVFCVDVSDSISATELETVVNALNGCLADADLIPQDGTISVATIVYGDTIATILNRTSVTADNLQNIIQPALTGLMTDRVVAGAGFDLSRALEGARTILEAVSAPDRHVFIIGSGAADNATAVETACLALENAGAMISAIAVGADAAGATLLQNCVDGADGFFAAEGMNCGDALAYMLQVEIDLEPENAELYRGETHTVTAVVFRGGDQATYPEAGIPVVTTVIAGPNAAETDTAVTNELGMITWSYLGNGAPGTDYIVASAVHPGTGALMTDTVLVTWLNHPPVCDAGGSYIVPVTADTARVTLNASGSSDADGDSLRFLWTVECEGGASFDDDRSMTPVLTITGECLCVDSFTVNLLVDDGFDSTACSATVHINDLRPPIIHVREDWLKMWPPNHKYQEITPEMMIVSVEDACGNPIDIMSGIVVAVRSDEPEIARGDGHKAEDIKVDCPNLVQLRVERMGGENGRVYTITYRYFTKNGVSGDAEAYAAVPHDSAGKPIVNDEGSGYTVIPECPYRK